MTRKRDGRKLVNYLPPWLTVPASACPKVSSASAAPTERTRFATSFCSRKVPTARCSPKHCPPSPSGWTISALPTATGKSMSQAARTKTATPPPPPSVSPTPAASHGSGCLTSPVADACNPWLPSRVTDAPNASTSSAVLLPPRRKRKEWFTPQVWHIIL